MRDQGRKVWGLSYNLQARHIRTLIDWEMRAIQSTP